MEEWTLAKRGCMIVSKQNKHYLNFTLAEVESHTVLACFHSIVFRFAFNILWNVTNNKSLFGVRFVKTLTMQYQSSLTFGWLYTKSLNTSSPPPPLHLISRQRVGGSSSSLKLTLKTLNLELSLASFFGQHVKLVCLDEDCLRNLIAVCAGARGRDTPTEDKPNF